jgi:hypothetical protein
MSLSLRHLCLAVLAVAVPPPAFAATPATAPWNAPAPVVAGATLVDRDPVEMSRYLGNSYKREADGFRLSPPAGSTLIERSGVDLLSFVVDAKGWGGALQRVYDQSKGLEDFVVSHRKSIVADWSFKGVQFLEEKPMRKGTFPAVRLSFSVEVTPATQPGKPTTPVSLLRQEFIVQSQDHQFYVLTFYASLRDKAEATRTFDAMISEFELFDASTREKRTDAAALAKSWLAQQSAEQFRSKIINQPQYFRILSGGQDVGYYRLDELVQEANPKGTGKIDVERDGHKGVLLLVNSRSFPSDGSVLYAQNDAFWAFSKDSHEQVLPDYFTWHNLSKLKTKVPASPTLARGGARDVMPWLEEIGIVVQKEQGAKSGKVFQLNVTLNGDDLQPLLSPDQQMVSVPRAGRGVSVTPGVVPGVNQMIPAEAPAPLPKILEYTWTRFVDLTKPSEMSFVVYDLRSKKVTLRNLIVTGKKEILTIDGQSVTCYKCIDELDPGSTTIWTDKDGRIQMMRTSSQSIIIPTTEAAMATKWANRLKDQ